MHKKSRCSRSNPPGDFDDKKDLVVTGKLCESALTRMLNLIKSLFVCKLPLLDTFLKDSRCLMCLSKDLTLTLGKVFSHVKGFLACGPFLVLSHGQGT